MLVLFQVYLSLGFCFLLTSCHFNRLTFVLQVTQALSQLSQYMERFRSRLKAKNVMYIKQLLFILGNFIKILGGKQR